MTVIQNDEALFADRYDALAEEYYDGVRHPTCRNLRQLSSQILNRALASRGRPELSCEIGAGASVLAELYSTWYGDTGGLILTDVSHAMLSYSRRFVATGAMLVVTRSEVLPLFEGSTSLVVSVLGDSYNRPALWAEMSRILRTRGWCIFTVPSYEWASEFRARRQDEREGWAYFELRGGTKVFVPSLVFKKEEQKAMIEEHGLCVREVINMGIEMVSPPVSEKLTLLKSGCPVVTGYIIEKADF